MINNKNSKEPIGNIHSIETLATLDGPGLRTVVFLQGCPLQCKFCHNVDCTIKSNAQKYTVDELFQKIIKNKPYWKNYNQYCKTSKKGKITGGVTMSGGEPTLQSDFLLAFLKRLKENTIHTSVDSCSVTSRKTLEKLLPHVDLWMLSIKHMDAEKHKYLTKVSNQNILENIKFLDKEITKKYKEKTEKIRIRFIVIPEITDSKEHILKLSDFVKQIRNLELVEILPYGSHGKHKWIELFGNYPLDHVADARKEDLEKVANILEKQKIVVKY